MDFNCFDCNTVTTVKVNFEVKSFVCPNCKCVYIAAADSFTYNKKFRAVPIEPRFKIGEKANFNNQDFVVTGILIKNAYNTFYWVEYILQGSEHNYLYLSEVEGHWTILEKIENDTITDVKFEKNVKMHDNLYYNLYANSAASVVAAMGYFDFILPNKTISTYEYINGLQSISIEKSHDLTETFLGKHLSTAAVKKAFSVTNLPPKMGVGLLQPFMIDLKNTALIFCSFALLILFTHYFLNRNQEAKPVLSTTIKLDDYNNKEIITPSFELVGSSAPLTISISSNVSNSWANAQIGLVNEKTAEENFASKDIEYYYGSSDGESWSEGSTSEEFNICGVGQGKYHLTIIPSKDSSNLSNDEMYITAVWSRPSLRNPIFIFIVMFVFWIGAYYFNREFEKKRWKDSDYSPYYYNEE